MPRFFVTGSQMQNDKIRITGQDARHIASVLRLKPGDSITVSDGSGTDYDCILQAVDAAAVCASIREEIQCSSEPGLKISLFQSLPKGTKMELVIQKTVELGVYEIFPVLSENTVVKLSRDSDRSHAKEERWQKIAEAAAKQSGRGIIPRVHPLLPLSAALDIVNSLDASIVAYEGERQRGLKQTLQQMQIQSLGIFIGPEGGFSSEEIEMFTSHNVLPVSLGRRILRTETAGLAALLLSLYEKNEL